MLLPKIQNRQSLHVALCQSVKCKLTWCVLPAQNSTCSFPDLTNIAFNHRIYTVVRLQNLHMWKQKDTGMATIRGIKYNELYMAV